VTDTDEQIDYEALKQREPILHHATINLFGDDFADNGEVELSVRMRVMPTSFFVLQRLLIRVDGVLMRVVDTRLYHRFGTQYILRECMLREQSVKELEAKLGVDPKKAPGAAASIYHKSNLNQLIEFLPVIKSQTQKIEMPPR
jgi:type 2A phosphatase activator TIP41